MKILDLYIIKKFLGTFFFTVLLFAAISVVVDVSEKIDDFIDKGASMQEIIFQYYLNFIPNIVFMLSPLFIFIAVIFFTSQMASRSEIISVTNGGVSFYRVLFVPYMIAAALLFALQMYANHYLVPQANTRANEFIFKYLKSKYSENERNVHLKIDKNTYIYVSGFTVQDSTARRFALEKFNDNKELTYKLMADRIKYHEDKGTWTLYNWFSRSINGLEEQLLSGDKKDTTLLLKPEDFGQKKYLKETMSTPELNEYIVSEQEKGAKNLELFIVERYRRTATPLATFILTIMGYSIASRKVRGGLGVHLFTGIALSSLYVIMLQFSTTFSTHAGLPPLIAVYVPNIFFGIISLYLVWRAQK